MHEVLVNRLGSLCLPKKSVVRLTDRPDMTLDVYRGRKTTATTTQQQQHQSCSIHVQPAVTRELLRSYLLIVGSTCSPLLLGNCISKLLDPRAARCYSGTSIFNCWIHVQPAVTRKLHWLIVGSTCSPLLSGTTLVNC